MLRSKANDASRFIASARTESEVEAIDLMGVAISA
jgi:hypothetical protein